METTLLKDAIHAAISHPAQVTRSIQTYLAMPPQSLEGLYDAGLEHLNSTLGESGSIGPSSPEVLAVSGTELKIGKRNNFRAVVTKELPTIEATAVTSSLTCRKSIWLCKKQVDRSFKFIYTNVATSSCAVDT
jgi:hypothetical protein